MSSQNLLDIKNRLYNPCGFVCSQPEMEPESTEYDACTFMLNDFSIRLRVAKITPTKIGQFVTLWKRVDNGPIQPYDIPKAFHISAFSRHFERSAAIHFAFSRYASSNSLFMIEANSAW